MRAIRLRTEYLQDPIGIDIPKPRLSWNCESGEKQKAYRILARDDFGTLAWDSGKVESDQMHLIPWEGRELHSRDRITWTVELWEACPSADIVTGGSDPENFSPEDPISMVSEPASFELGLLSPSDWQASWITGDYYPKKGIRYPVDCFRKRIHRTGRVQKARIYATACGLYEIRIDGKKAGDFCLAPGYTDYRKRIQYQTIDVTDLLQKEDEVTLTASLADGWYRGTVGAHGIPCEFGTETAFRMQLEIRYEDGSSQITGTDETWEWSNDGPIRFADNKDGEKVNACRTPSYRGKARITERKVVPTASDNVPLTEQEAFPGRKSKSPSGKLLFDFGQNLAGQISFSLEARRGQKLRIRLGEMLGKDGELTLANIQTKGKNHPTPLQQIDYVCENGRNDYRMTFAIAGYQYAEVTFAECSKGEKKALEESMEMISHAVYSHIQETGFFSSSNELLNRFVQATKWSAKSNSADIPTDCPTRERHGWTGDAQIFFESASLLFDYAAFSRKYLRDVYDWQKKDGRLPQIAPYGGVDFFMWVMNGSVGWSDIGILLPWRFWRLNGDRQILEQYYDRMRSYARFMEKRCGTWGGPYAAPTGVKGPAGKYVVNAGQSYGEWAEPQDVCRFVWTDFAAPHPEVSTAYTVYMMDLMVEIAGILGREEDIPEYRRYAEGCRQAYRELVHRNPKYTLDTDRQAQLVRPLYLHLLDEKDEAYARDRLLEALDHYGWRLGTGFLSTPFILKVLQTIEVEAAYRLLENEEIPGWLSMPRAGATTIWEAWEGSAAEGEVASLNHYSKGALCEWLFEEMCGIHVDGPNHFRIAPLPGGHFAWAKASCLTVYGKVDSGWEKTGDGQWTFQIEIPANTTALVQLPGQEVKTVGPGKWNFSSQ